MTFLEINQPLYSALRSVGCDEDLAIKAASIPTDPTKETHEDLYRALCGLGTDEDLARKAAVNVVREITERARKDKRNDLLGSRLIASMMFGLVLSLILIM